VEISARIIIKRFPLGSSARVSRVMSIYHLLTEKRVRHIDQIIHAYSDTLVFVPHGRTSSHPQTEKQLCEALVCVLEALVVSFTT
jgi:hypothetical protein